MGIDQLALHSVQLGYLKILQMGNTDPNNTIARKEIRGQTSVRRAIKAANHETCYKSSYEMHEALKGIGNQDQHIDWQINSSEPLYNAQPIGRWKSSVCDHRGSSAHHSSVVDTRIRQSSLR
ncbi:hypothetical protein F511_35075 [Dorcoceras hygrometricum]|uniref:Uncharacterized protein n=1 Tax=Dorcoceras hygrometricum TaxID=472368 RepID=A0A2Z7A4D1_9LAMI|nr:hypothetical protein F511_35075 [Dorcoceras hygrometricum]